MSASEEGEGQVDLDTTPSTGFNPPIASTPGKANESFQPPNASTPKKNIRFMDESVSKIHVYPSLSASSYNKKNVKNYTTALPVIPDEAQPFNPILYTFRIPDQWPKMLTHLKVRSPPFYLQLDHAIAVIWCLFCPNVKKILGIAQLHWALSFLNSLSNRKRQRPRDIQVCIDAIEDYLIELYADLSKKLSPLKNMEISQREQEESPVPSEIPFSLNYSEMIPKSRQIFESGLAGGPLANVDDVFRREMEGLRNVVRTDSMELMTSKSREAAIDYLKETRNHHLKNMSKEVERIRSLENLLSIIKPAEEDRTLDSLLASFLRHDDSSDLNDTSEIGRSDATDI